MVRILSVLTKEIMASDKRRPTKRALDAGELQRSRAWSGRCSLEAHSPDLRHFRAFFWLRAFTAPKHYPRPPQRQ